MLVVRALPRMWKEHWGQKRRQNRSCLQVRGWCFQKLLLFGLLFLQMSKCVQPCTAWADSCCLLCAGDDSHDILPLTLCGKCHHTHSNQLSGILLFYTFSPRISLWSFWTVPLLLWFDQVASWDFHFSIKLFWFNYSWSPTAACFSMCRSPSDTKSPSFHSP